MPTEDWRRDDRSGDVDDARSIWLLEGERSMRACGVVVLDVLVKYVAQVTLVQRGDVVDALLPAASDNSRRIPFACGARTGVNTVSMPMLRARAMRPTELDPASRTVRV